MVSMPWARAPSTSWCRSPTITTSGPGSTPSELEGAGDDARLVDPAELDVGAGDGVEVIGDAEVGDDADGAVLGLRRGEGERPSRSRRRAASMSTTPAYNVVSNSPVAP